MNNEFENTENEFEEKTTVQKIKSWAQENIRIITSILIVCLIGFSVYSYSNRGEKNVAINDAETSEIENILDDLVTGDTAEVTDENTSENTTETDAPVAAEEITEEAVAVENNKATPALTEVQETNDSFVEVADRGDGITHLARKALSHYLEKNANIELSAEHKIYIEDYLRKNITHSEQIQVGQTIEFSKSLISDAINSAENLSASQLQNLQQYTANVQF